MHSLELPEINKRLWLPENLGECDKRQYLDACKLVLMYQMGDVTLEQFRVLLLYSLLNMEFEENSFEHIQEDFALAKRPEEDGHGADVQRLGAQPE